MPLSHKKFKEMVSAFSQCVDDQETLAKLITIVKTTLAYSENQPTYSVAGYEKRKNAESWKEYRRKYYEEHKQEIIQKNTENYHKRKSKEDKNS